MFVFTVDINQIPPSTAPAGSRPQRSTRKQVDWSLLLSDDDNSGDDIVDNEDFD